MQETVAACNRQERHGMRRVLPVFVTILVLVAPSSVSADSSRIVIGRSIGVVGLGTTESAVVRIYGRPRTTERFEFVSGEVGRVARYRRHPGAFRITSVGGIVGGVDTAARNYRTSGGIGPGSPIAAGVALPGFRFDPVHRRLRTGDARRSDLLRRLPGTADRLERLGRQTGVLRLLTVCPAISSQRERARTSSPGASGEGREAPRRARRSATPSTPRAGSRRARAERRPPLVRRARLRRRAP
jgi:hypothetical protein